MLSYGEECREKELNSIKECYEYVYKSKKVESAPPELNSN